MSKLSERIEAGRKALLEAREAPDFQDKNPTKTDIILGLRDEIVLMRSQKFSWGAISEALHETVEVSPEGLRLIMAGYKKKKAMTTRKQAKQESKRVKTLLSPQPPPTPEKLLTARTTLRPVMSDDEDQFPTDSQF
jgi:hypothetical protein